MIIDFHTHAFPDKLAERAMAKLSFTGDIESVGDGTISNLLARMDEWGIDSAVLLNIATNPRQQSKVNDFAIEVNNTQPRIYSLGSLNPDSDCIASEAKRIADAGIRGIKIHPDYVLCAVDDPKFDAVYKACVDNNMFVVSHAGWDFVSPDFIHCTPERILRVLEKFPELKFVAAHMGGNRIWDDAERLLVGKNVWFDTSLSEPYKLSPEQAARIIKNHDPDKVLFGSDFPWFTSKDSYGYIESLDIPENLKHKITGENALRLLEG